MSWIEKLYDTYDEAQKNYKLNETLPPICHTTQNAHIEIIINGEGNFVSAKVIEKKEAPTLIPATEDSSTRTGQCAPHPLCDTIQYVAGDFAEYVEDEQSYFEDFKKKDKTYQGYKSLLSDWCNKFPTPKNLAILKYVSKNSVIADLVEAKILFKDEKTGKLLENWTESDDNKPKIFEVSPTPNNPFIRWKVQIPEIPEEDVWKDRELFQSWIDYDSSSEQGINICFVTGKEKRITQKHPSKIRNSGDRTKLISSNDEANFTFRGRFKEAEQAAGISYEVSQKAHTALRWLIERGQSFRSDSLCIVSWDISGNPIPNSFEDNDDLFLQEEKVLAGDMGQAYSKHLKGKIAGYSVELKDSKRIIVLGLDSTGGNTGRLAVIYYKEMASSEFLERVEEWHLDFSWFQKIPKRKDENDPKSKNILVEFQGAPCLKPIIFAAYGSKVDDKLKNATIRRLLPCVIDGQKMPFDLVDSAFKRTVNKISMSDFEWDMALGISCSLFKGFHKEERYQMGLEIERKTKDYLFGRLLAVAEEIESKALYIAGEDKGRSTNAERYMQRFSTNPCSTWLIIEKNLAPYEQRLKSTKPKFLFVMKNLIDEICNSFNADEFSDDKPLSGEFLLGYHCQRHELNKSYKKEDSPTKDKTDEEETNDESEQEN